MIRKYVNRKLMEFVAFSLLGLIFAQPVSAARVELPVSRYAYISSGDETRVLIDFSGLDELQGKRILYAKFVARISLDSCGETLEFMVAPLVREWDPGTVDWASAWDSAGGDYSVKYGDWIAAEKKREGLLEVIISELVQSWVDGKSLSQGLVLIPLAGTPDLCPYILIDAGLSAWGEHGHLIVKYADGENKN